MRTTQGVLSQQLLCSYYSPVRASFCSGSTSVMVINEAGPVQRMQEANQAKTERTQEMLRTIQPWTEYFAGSIH